MKHIILSCLLALALALPASAVLPVRKERNVQRSVIEFMKGNVHLGMYMECAWLQDKTITFYAKRYDGETETETETKITYEIDPTYIEFTVPEELMADATFTGLKVTYEVDSEKPCSSGYPPSNIFK